MLAEANWMYAEAHRDKEKQPRPFKLAEFMPGGEVSSHQPQSPQEMHAVMMRLRAAIGPGKQT